MFCWVSEIHSFKGKQWNIYSSSGFWKSLHMPAAADVSFHDSGTKWNSWLGSQDSELTLKLSDSTESSVCLRTCIKSCDPADGLCRSRNMRHKSARKTRCGRVRLPGSNSSNSHVFSHDCSHTWLSGWMDYAHVHTCDWRSALEETHTREVFMPERDYVLWKGNLPWRGRTLLSEYNNSTGKSVGGTNTEMYQKLTPLW